MTAITVNCTVMADGLTVDTDTLYVDSCEQSGWGGYCGYPMQNLKFTHGGSC